VSGAEGAAFGLIGTISAYPRRQLARAVEAAGGRLKRGISRQTSHVVFAASLLRRCTDEALAERLAGAARPGRQLLSERAFLAAIGLLPGAAVPGAAGLSRAAIVAQSGLGEADFDALVLFDAFEAAGEPFAFRDLILARMYAGLIGSGASWQAIARSVQRSGAAVSLTAKSLAIGEGSRLYVRDGERLSELDGQLLLGLDAAAEEPDELFLDAQSAEDEGRFEEAAALYARCLVHDPTDATAAFNRGNALREAGRPDEAEVEYLRALRHDPAFVEAWFNIAALAREGGRPDKARRALEEAIACDPGYGDAVFNLATLSFDAGDLKGAAHWWSRYLELDPASEWARQAARGLAYVAQQTSRHAG